MTRTWLAAALAAVIGLGAVAGLGVVLGFPAGPALVAGAVTAVLFGGLVLAAAARAGELEATAAPPSPRDVGPSGSPDADG